ncbi:hypothetical protein BS636_14905 [Acinetobacter sp. LoGeW2-3]|uniref:OmpA family protein n=1 Tax=Acinetobacter sp. LoGeW2-3 TaxID=1808001 RepID=UPI000C05C72D|nr:OmpA family protein [Acinetobacter sp. LoGeW2-3]ATO20875.1 hypothetical protein BS636_14905 [Acinetobacter sp. LoGeW2-3]
MNEDLIQRLKYHVTPTVLQGETEYVAAKEQALAQFYPIFLSVLRAHPEQAETLGQQLNPKISELFTEKPEIKQRLLDHLANTSDSVPQEQLEQTLNRSIKPTIEYLKTEADASNPDAINYVIETNNDSIQKSLPAWASPLLLTIGASPLVDHHPTPVPGIDPEPVEPPVQKAKRNAFLVPVFAFIAVAVLIMFFFRGCTRDDDPDDIRDMQKSQAAATQPAFLKLSTGSEGQITSCQVQVNDQQYMEILQNEIKQIYNYNIGCGTANNQSYHSQFIDQDAIPTVLKTIQGVPNVSLNWVGDQVSVQAANSADAARITGEIRNLAKNMQVMAQQPVKPQQMASAQSNEAEKVLASMQTEQIKALDVATALNLQAINFAAGSTEIPETNQSILDQTAALMKRAPQVHLRVIGHTDAQGNEEQNKQLSLQRAQAIMNYLIKQGVDPAQVNAVGIGSAQPNAGNAKEVDRYKNRRIAFEVMNIDTGTVRAVDEQGVKQKV